jgi:hypothetical protein
MEGIGGRLALLFIFLDTVGYLLHPESLFTLFKVPLAESTIYVYTEVAVI